MQPPMDKHAQDQFIAVFQDFKKDLYTYSNTQFLSFTSGVPDEWEGYKPRIQKIANERLQAATWTLSDIGTGKILSAVIAR